MKISPPALVVYGCTYDRVIDIIRRNRLRHCELDAFAVTGIWFEHDADLVAFALEFRGEIGFEDNLATVFLNQQASVEEFITRMQMAGRIQRHDLLAMWFWDTQDQAVMDTELGFEPKDS